jgi:two-component system chemotaxis response regulator CheB
MNEQRIKVLVVEDSKAPRMLLVRILRGDPRIQVVGAVQNGFQAIQFLTHASPDVILMDIEMPKMNGFEATRRIMEIQPVPIVICSASGDPHETMTTFRSMEAGAVACLEKPRGIQHKDFAKMAAHLLETVKLMSEIKVVRRWARYRESAIGARCVPALEWAQPTGGVELVGMGASTGGPSVLETILRGLSRDLGAPVLIVQHIAPGFLPGMVQWLRQSTGAEVHIAAHGARPLPGHVYLAPDDVHMIVAPDGRIALDCGEPFNGPRPSVARLFDSIADVCGPRGVGVLLTGMGKDGAQELARMKNLGALTIAQDRASSVVHGMPGEAIALGAATWVLAADRIAPALNSLMRQKSLSGEDHEYIGSNSR